MPDYSKGTPTTNLTILTERKTLKNVVSSSAEAETGGTFENAQNIIPLRHIIENMLLHRQPTKVSPIVADNLTSQGTLTFFIRHSKSKTWDMRYHWLEDHIYQRKMQLIWKCGIYN